MINPENEFFVCRELATKLLSRGEVLDLEELTKAFEDARRVALAEYKRAHEISLPAYGTVAVNQLVAHLESRVSNDKATNELLQALHSSFKVRSFQIIEK